MEKSVKIRITTIMQIKEFVAKVSAYNGEVDLTSGRYTVDAKSIMGIFSLDLLSDITMTVRGDNADALIESLKDFMVE